MLTGMFHISLLLPKGQRLIIYNAEIKKFVAYRKLALTESSRLVGVKILIFLVNNVGS